MAVLLAQGVSPVCDHLPLVPTALSGLDEEVAVRLLDLLLSRGMEWWYAMQQEGRSELPEHWQWGVLEGAVEEGRLATHASIQHSSALTLTPTCKSPPHAPWR